VSSGDAGTKGRPLTQLDEYADRYSRVRLRRDDGILEVRFHDGADGVLQWDEAVHRELPQLWQDIGADPDNRVVIVTGTGEAFCAEENRGSWEYPISAERWDALLTETVSTHRRHLDIPVPMIAAINGPLRFHAEVALLCDIVLASEDTVIEDASHMPNSPPNDISGNLWPWLLGMNQGRYFVLTGQILSADEAKQAGVVAEVLPRDEVLPRAWEHARALADTNPLVLKYARTMLTQKLKRVMLPDMEMGMAMMGLCAMGWTMDDEKPLTAR
jgi:enoyl-CoA hydratase/carnithine racemase